MRIRRLVLLLGVFGLASCSDNGGVTVVPNSLIGRFELVTVNETTLPAVVVDSANSLLRIDALSGTFTINSDNTFTDITSIRQTLRGITTTRVVTCVGTFRVVGTVFEFVEAGVTADCAHTFTGVVSGTTLNASVLGFPAVFTM